ncbi:MAG: leucine-rich repeat domain-containing protein [Oscillospiraceae bacterium]|nr:leucine-rich repeat domain-containing protein [Oscillospiraceae bacterium]
MGKKKKNPAIEQVVTNIEPQESELLLQPPTFEELNAASQVVEVQATGFRARALKLFKEHRQPFIAGGIVVLALIVFGIIQLVNYDSSLSDAERFKNRADRYHSSMDIRRAINFYELALELDPAYEEVYVILYNIHADGGDRVKARDVLLRGISNVQDSAELLQIYAVADYPIEWVSEDFKRDIRRALEFDEFDEDAEIWRGDLDEIESVIWVSWYGEDMSDLRHFENLSSFTAGQVNGVATLNALETLGITDLKRLNLSNVGLSDEDTALILRHENLEYLGIAGNSFTDITPFLNMIKLQGLVVNGNPFAFVDTAAINAAALCGLEVFGLPHNLTVDKDDYYVWQWENEFIRDRIIWTLRITDGYVPKSSLDEMTRLSLTFGILDVENYTDLSDLQKTPRLENLAISHNFLDLSTSYSTNRDAAAIDIDFETIGGLKHLKHLSLTNCKLGDLSELKHLSGLQSLESLDLSKNEITDLSPFAEMDLPAINTLTLTSNEIVDIEPLTALTSLEALYLNRNSVEDIRPLKYLVNLHRVNFQENPLRTLDYDSTAHIEIVVGLPNMSLADENDYYVFDWADETVKEIILDSLGIRDGFVAKSRLDRVSYFGINFAEVAFDRTIDEIDFSDLEKIPNVTNLTISNFRGQGLPFAEYFKKAELLALNYCTLEGDVRFSAFPNLTGINLHNSTAERLNFNFLPELQSVTIYDSDVAEIATFAGVPKLDGFSYSFDIYSDIPPDDLSPDLFFLTGAASLKSVRLHNLADVDLSPLSPLPNLSEMTLTYCRFGEELSLRGYRALSDLTVSESEFGTLRLENLPLLEEITLWNVAIEEVHAGEGLELKALTVGGIDYGDYAWIGAFAEITELTLTQDQDRRIHDTKFDFAVLTPLVNLNKLTLSGFGGLDLSPLAEVAALEDLVLRIIESNDVVEVHNLPQIKSLRIEGGYYGRETEYTFEGLDSLEKLSIDTSDNKYLVDFERFAGLVSLNELRLTLRAWDLDLEPLESLVNLETLYIQGRGIASIAPLLGLDKLTSLTLRYNGGIGDMEELATLVGLTELTIHGGYRDGYEENDISFVAPLVNLTELTLIGHSVADLSPLANLTGLETLTLASNLITDLSPLANLTGLETLTLSSNLITDLSPLAGLTALESLNVGSNGIVDLSPLAGLTGLKTLWLGMNQIRDLTPLSGLFALEHLDVESNQITDFTPLAGLTNLEELHGRQWDVEDVDYTPMLELMQRTEENMYYYH